MNISILAIDLAKNVFQLHAVDATGKVLLRRRESRIGLRKFVSELSPCLIAMEACSSSNYWGREFQAMGHTVRLIPPQYVKPYVKTNKNDLADAEAIAEAMSRAGMRTTSVKSQEQQDIQVLHRCRARIIEAKTCLMNSLRSLCAEYGIVTPRGTRWLRSNVSGTREQLARTGSQILQLTFERILTEFRQLIEEEDFYDKQLAKIAASHPIVKRLMQIPGVGVLAATSVLAVVNHPNEFKNGRHFAAFLGLVPRQHSSGGKQKLLGISKRGNQYLRRILVSGAQSVIRWAPRRKDKLGEWIHSMRQRKAWNTVAVALANKNARIIWSLLQHDVDYVARVSA